MVDKLEKFKKQLLIRNYCFDYGIKNYTINEDLSIDVDGDVYIQNKNLSNLPIIFNKVSGNFACGHNQLTTLAGCPKYVGGDFYCNNNQLTTLDGIPEVVKGNISCAQNDLISFSCKLIDFNGVFYCQNNCKIEDAEYYKLFKNNIVPDSIYTNTNLTIIYRQWVLNKIIG